MNNVNTFWQNTRERDVKKYEKSLTVPDMGINLAELINNGKLEEVSEKLKKRMIYGTKIKITDLTQIDYFRKKLERYENLIRVNAKNDVNTYIKQEPDKANTLNNKVTNNEKQLKIDDSKSAE